ncbi:hypothetical protein SKAU_G00303220 [Synaphobranchus kaupii]|uniref:Uncharacterized protein n=1 Tax=Synaphobranchus kaupii TaxID=118154 RepID=A0A9Q1EW48_SYNKA|nr:hypothetical protein SKAU_G00303220 [Synaphobranchus kaupii]
MELELQSSSLLITGLVLAQNTIAVHLRLNQRAGLRQLQSFSAERESSSYVGIRSAERTALIRITESVLSCLCSKPVSRSPPRGSVRPSDPAPQTVSGSCRFHRRIFISADGPFSSPLPRAKCRAPESCLQECAVEKKRHLGNAVPASRITWFSGGFCTGGGC